MKEGLSDSIIPDTHAWESTTAWVVKDNKYLWEIPIWVCHNCHLAQPLKSFHGSDPARKCPKEPQNVIGVAIES